MKKHILIIEDEEDILELEEYHLQKEGYEVSGFLSTKNVENFLEEERVDLLIVDRNLPGAEGSEFVKHLREVGHQMPVIFVSAKVEDDDIEEGFLRGGDDYLRKPYNMNELLFRVKSLLKRVRIEESEVLKHRDLTLDITKRELFVDGESIAVSKLEFELLSYFLKNKDMVLNRYELLENVWGDDEHTQEKTVNVTINRLLKKIDSKKEKNYIESIRGVGYKLC